jgi:hypothetical protein
MEVYHWDERQALVMCRSCSTKDKWIKGSRAYKNEKIRRMVA